MKGIRSAVIALTVCLLLGCLSMAVQAQEIPKIQLGETVTFSTTRGNHIVYYSFTAPTSGTYVLYDLSDCAFQAWLSVYTASPVGDSFKQSLLTKGLNRVSFEAQAGVTYWLELDCSWISGGALRNSFKLTAPGAATGIEIGYASLSSQFVGAEGALFLQYTPMDAVSKITWTTSDASVATVQGDANGCAFRLTGAGSATITATSAEDHQASYKVTVLDALEMAVGDSRTISMFSDTGGYISTEKFIRFTPTQSGSYALSVSFDQTLEVWHGVELSMGSGANYVRSDKVLRIDAEAGKTYTVSVDFWGMYSQKVDYTFRLQPCVEPERMELVSPGTAGYVGGSIDVEVVWLPENTLGDKLQWTVGDTAIAQIAASDDGSALLRLLSEGTTTLTATSESGLSASLEITVFQHPGPIALVSGANPALQMLRNDYFDCTFTPDVTGYYRFTADHSAVKLQLDGPIVIRAGERLYYLEAGKMYTGGIDNLSEDVFRSVITVSLVEVPTPTAITITKLPDQTEFLPGILENIWVYDLLEGMEMSVTWSDGKTTTWSFDKDGTSYEGYEIGWQLKDSGSNRKELIMKLGDVSTSCTLTVNNLTVVGIKPVDANGIRIVENSCGYYDNHAKAWIYSEYLLGTHGVEITFSDGSTVVAYPGQTVYGKRLLCQMDQYDKPWVKGGHNFVTYSYGTLSAQVAVEIIDSPVRRIQFITTPRSSFTIGDRNFFASYGDGTYYFVPDNLKLFLEGLSFRIYYHDDTYKIVTWEDIQWRKVSGVLYPFVDGYPLGLMGELMMRYDSILEPCTSEGLLEYMGASVTYTIELTAPAEGVPGTADSSLEVPVLAGTLAILGMAIILPLKKKLV